MPNLIEVAKGAMQHERATLEALTAARNQAVLANTQMAQDPTNSIAARRLGAAESELTSALGKMFVVSESYPDLEANQTMLQLTEDLSSTENRIAFARQAYNDGVMEYNTELEQFPGLMVANMLAFKTAELLQSTESPDERKAVKVSF